MRSLSGTHFSVHGIQVKSSPMRLTITRLLTLLLLILLTEGTVTAQDPQFSQFYAAPLYLNPAFAGSTNQARAGVNFRNQWPAIDASFTTLSAYFDYFIEDKNSGVG